MAAFLIGCYDFNTVENTDKDLSIVNGLVFYKGKPFTGKLKQEILPMNEIHISEYKDGAEDGEYTAKKKDGSLLERRYFKAGVKEGIHRSWFPNGKDRLYSEFKNGTYINDRWEWHDNGVPALYERYNENGNILVTKKWRRTGQIYMNLSFLENGGSIGLPGSKICEPIKSTIKKGE
ncbi:MAG TPA: hypothetical protein PK079_05815 [Leptospiraceae bacterium]|nr:hypothetical protein [Leptospiraceae bacterium]HMW05693.1 hypothetical protein [Leptospiraceae bacterium]HMX35074.1 hypothetical protein [Leptospiraceae bacterium]HMY30274.1 hypothetical protein [Leptospiraceae bacterium]HMZ66393.1 hypothetical protein [Leptospiraceae bacterium]